MSWLFGHSHAGHIDNWRVVLPSEFKESIVNGLRCVHCGHVTCNRIVTNELSKEMAMKNANYNSKGKVNWTDQKRPTKGTIFD